MIWLLIGISACAVNVIAGRSHSRYLDRLEARSNPMQQFLNVSPVFVEQIESC
jgi:hypothetical protein